MKEPVLKPELQTGGRIKVRCRFVTPVGELVLPNAGELNPVLEAALRARAEGSWGNESAQGLTWQSGHDLFRWPEVRESGFFDIVRTACHKVIGLLVVFPSWLCREVRPFRSDTARISIEFESYFEKFQDLGPA